MITRLDDALNRVTMYRLVLYVLVGLVCIAAALAAFGLLPFSPLALLVSVCFLLVMCWATNTLLARVFNVPTNVESALITALILAQIVDPPRSLDDLPFLGWVAILAMASKYILALNKRHLFNPAAIAVVITAFALGEPASWWVGTASMLPATLLGGVLVVRKVRQGQMVALFLAASLATVSIVSLLQGVAVAHELDLLLLASPLFFFAVIMLTEPLTAPPTRHLRGIYAVLVGMLIVPQIHVGTLYSTPELALIAGNLFSYLVSPKWKVALRLKKKTRLSSTSADFVFAPSRPLAFAPGQYIECTLAHAHPDSRGNRRYFTIASSPTEATLHLGVRFYERGSSFKRAMRAMDARALITAGQIAGDFTLPRDRARKLVFVAGGIGITPYRSMLKYLLDTKQHRDIVLIYAARTAEDIVYKEVLSEAQAQLGIKTVYALTDATALPPNWTGYSGRLDAPMLLAAVPDYGERTFYLSGPSDMVRAHEHVLRQMGVKRRRIKRDFFPGLV
jgi:ferredoxin-NADP reductase/Na+-translocating ferredoxin:NAD+ oxidoreductase RnfD subunit